MPLLQVLGIPPQLHDHLEVATFRHEDLPAAAASIDEMTVTTDMVTVTMPTDPGVKGDKVIVLILGLFRKKRPQRTDVVLERFAEALCDCTIEMVIATLPNCTKIEVFDPANIDICFADWTRPPEIAAT